VVNPDIIDFDEMRATLESPGWHKIRELFLKPQFLNATVALRNKNNDHGETQHQRGFLDAIEYVLQLKERIAAEERAQKGERAKPPQVHKR